MNTFEQTDSLVVLRVFSWRRTFVVYGSRKSSNRHKIVYTDYQKAHLE